MSKNEFRSAKRIDLKTAKDLDQAPSTGRNQNGSAYLLMIMPLIMAWPLVFKLLSGQALGLLAVIAAILLFAIAAGLVRSGLSFEKHYNRLEIARGARFPAKLLGHISLGLGFFIALGFGSSYGLLFAVLVGILAGFASYMAYGLDPMRGKTIDEALAEAAGVTSERATRLVLEAQERLARIAQNRDKLKAHDFRASLQSIDGSAQTIIDMVQKDLKDLNQSRRFFVTYLDQIEGVTQAYVERETEMQKVPQDYQDKFRRVLTTIDQAFKDQIKRLKENDLMDLDVQLDVLQTQIEKEGFS